MKDLQEIISDFVVEERIVKVHSWDSRNSPEHHVLDARLHRAGHRNRFAVATEPGRYPQYIEFADGFGSCHPALVILTLRSTESVSEKTFRLSRELGAGRAQQRCVLHKRVLENLALFVCRFPIRALDRFS